MTMDWAGMAATTESDDTEGAGVAGWPVVTPQPQPQPTSGDGELRLFDPRDLPRVERLYKRIIGYPWFWEDSIVQAGPQAMLERFIHIFCAPTSLAFDLLDDAGVICFGGIHKGWSAQSHVAIWDARAYARHDLLRRAARIACEAHGLLVVWGFVPRGHHLALRNAERAGMALRGWIKDAVTYNGVTMDKAWFEIARDELAVEVEAGNGHTHRRHPDRRRIHQAATGAGAQGDTRAGVGAAVAQAIGGFANPPTVPAVARDGAGGVVAVHERDYKWVPELQPGSGNGVHT